MSVIQFKTGNEQEVSFYLPSAGKARFLIEEAFHNIVEDLDSNITIEEVLTDQIVDLLNLLEVYFIKGTEAEEATIDNE